MTDYNPTDDELDAAATAYVYGEGDFTDLTFFPVTTMLPEADGDIALLEELEAAILLAVTTAPQHQLRGFRPNLTHLSVLSIEGQTRRRVGDWRGSWPRDVAGEQLRAWRDELDGMRAAA